MTLERFEDLYERYGDGLLSPSELAEFKLALKDPALARKVVEWSMFEAVIYDELRLAAEEPQAQATATRPVSAVHPSVRSGKHTRISTTSGRQSARRVVRKVPSYWGIGIAATILLMALAGYYKFAAMKPAGEATIATLLSASDTSVKRIGGKVPATKDFSIRDGDVLFVGANGSAVLEYPDNTRVELVGGSELAVQLRDDAKRLVLKQGSLDASVSKQPEGRPMRIATSESEAVVLGTELTMQALDRTTRLSVKSGQVTLKRSDDGQSVDVAGGQFAVAAKGAALLAKPLPPSQRLLEDFENGAATRWKSFVGDPKISKISVKTVEGKVGRSALQMDVNPSGNDGGGALYVLPEVEDWSGYDGVRFWVRGQRSGTMLNIEVFDNRPKGNSNRDNWERFVFEFIDDFDGWRQMTVPFSQFQRRNFQREGAPNDGFTLTEIHGFDFMGSRGRSVFAVDYVELYRK